MSDVQPAFFTEADAQMLYQLAESEQRTNEYCIAPSEAWAPVLEALRAAWPSLPIKTDTKSADDPPHSTMIFLGGSKTSFRCQDCGANVFTKLGPHRYVCNGCGDVYTDTPST